MFLNLHIELYSHFSGLFVVVDVIGATRLIRDGDRIRVNGDEGYVKSCNYDLKTILTTLVGLRHDIIDQGGIF